MKCILHIGTEKTGTTLIQNWLYENREVLSQNKVYLSGSLWFPNNLQLPYFFTKKLDVWAKRNKIFSIEEKKRHLQDNIESFKLEVLEASQTHDTTIITSEFFHSKLTTATEVNNLKKYLFEIFTEVKVICYFRHQADLLVSLYSTYLIGGGTNDLDVFIENATSGNSHYFNYKGIADLWSSAFKRERCEFRIYDRAGFVENDIRADFLSALNLKINKSELDFSIEKSNVSLSYLKALLYKDVNLTIPFLNAENGGYNINNKNLKKAISATDFLHDYPIYSEGKDKIAESFEEANTLFLGEYFEPETQFNWTQKDQVVRREYSEQELRILISKLMSNIVKYTLPEPHKVVRTEDIDVLRGVALKIEGGADLGLSEAKSLMEIAFRFRPDGQLLESKVKEYSLKLEALKMEPCGTQSALKKLGFRLASLARVILNFVKF